MDLRIDTVTGMPKMTVSGTLSVERNVFVGVGQNNGRPEIGSLNQEGDSSSSISALNMFIGGSGGQGDVTLKSGITTVVEDVYIGGKRDQLDATGSLTVSDHAIMYARQLKVEDTGNVMVENNGKVYASSVVFEPPSSSGATTGTITLNDDGYLVTNSVITSQADHAIVLNGGALEPGWRSDTDTARPENAEISGPGVLRIEKNGGIINANAERVNIALRIEGTGTLTLIDTDMGTVTLSGNNTYLGSTIVQVGTLAAGGTNTLSPNSNIHLGYASTLDINGAPQVIGALLGEETSTVTNNGSIAANLTVGQNNKNGEYRGTILDGGGYAYLGVHKAGSGTQIFIGNNRYTGGTVIHKGALQVGNGGTSGSIIGNINNSGVFIINRSDEMSLPGNIEGGGTFVKEGSGNLILNGKNVYSGTTFIKSGTLSQGKANAFSPNSDVSMETTTVLDLLGKDGRIGGLSGNRGSKVTNSGISDATLTVGTNSSGGNFIGNIEDGPTSSVSLNKDGTGTQILSGTNTYSGKTIVSDGTLAQGAKNTFSARSDVVIKAKGTMDVRSQDSAIGSLSGAVGAKVTSTGTGNAVLNIGATNSSGTFHGVIKNDPSSSLSIHKVGTGTQVFTGDNTNTGTLVISSGALQLGNGGTSGSFVSPEIQNDGALIINRSDEVILTGTIQGTGSLAQIGSGTTILIANNIYTGGTTIDAGTLVGTTSSLQRNISNRGRLVFAQTGTGAFIGTISGSGGVIINSPGGGVTFNSDQTYTGATVVQNGALFVNRYLKSTTVQVNPRGILGGTGTLRGDVINSGTIQRGDDPLALTINGNYTQNSNGAFVTQLENESAYDRLAVGGNAELDGTLRVGLVGESIPSEGAEFTILTAAGTRKGAFGDLYLPPKVPLEIIYGVNDIRLLVPRKEPVQVLESLAPSMSEAPYIKNLALHTGNLVNNRTLRSDNIQIGPDATLSGTGVLIGRLVNSGVVSPGNNGTNGTMTVHGGYVQNPTGILVIDGADDRLRVIGTAQLDGTLHLSDKFSPNDRPDFTFLIADGGITGTFSGLNVPPGAALKIVYSTNEARLSNVNEVRLSVTSTFVGQTPRQQVMADALNTTVTIAAKDIVGQSSGTGADPPIGASSTSDPSNASVKSSSIGDTYRGNLGVFIWLLATLSPEEAASYLEQLAPLIVINIKDIIFNAANTQYGQLTARLAAMRAGVNRVSLNGLAWEPMFERLSKHEAKTIRNRKGIMTDLQEPYSRWDVFASASGVFSKINNPNDLPRINSMTGYFCAGADSRINDYVNTGIYVGYQGFKAWYSDGAWLRSNGVKFGLYGTARWEGFYLNTIVGGGANFVNMNRPINIKHRNWVVRSYPFAGELNSLLGGGYELNLGPWRFGVNNSIQYTYLGVSSFQEFGAGTLNVRGGPHNPSSLVYSLGGNIYYLWEIFPGYQVLPTIGLSWQHEFLNYGQRIVGAFANGLGAPFYFYTPTGARNNAFGTAGVTAQLGRRIGMYAYYSPQFGGGQIVSHGVAVGLTHHF